MARRGGTAGGRTFEVDDEYDDFAHDAEAIPAHQYDDDDNEYEYIRPRRRRRPWRRVLLVAVLVIIVGGLVAGLLGWNYVQERVDPPGDPGEEVVVVVPDGSTTSDIGSLLEEEGIIADATVWRYYIRFRGGGPFQAGEYVLRENSSMPDAIETLSAGPAPPPFMQWTVPEGLTLPEITDAIVDDAPTLSADTLNELIGSGQLRSRHQPPEVSSLEGYLFPETYRLDRGSDEVATLQAMLDQFDRTADELSLGTAAAGVGLTPYQVVTVASLIQEEARIPEDAPRIARVIYNRIAQGMPLQIDATTCYILGERPCELTESDLAIDSPYNTRVNAGLPPTPIAAPGRAALEAALAPEPGPWLFYVLDPEAEIEGGHFFTADYNEFLQKKDECEAAGLGCG
jgi:UPF0755 protein